MEITERQVMQSRKVGVWCKQGGMMFNAGGNIWLMQIGDIWLDENMISELKRVWADAGIACAFGGR